MTLFSSKKSIQLLSQRVPIDMRGFCRPGHMCAWRALSGGLCCGSSAMWDDVMISPIGILIGIGLVAVCLFGAWCFWRDVVSCDAGIRYCL